MDPATLAWVLSQLKISSSARLPYGVEPAAIEEFRSELVGHLEDRACSRQRGLPQTAASQATHDARRHGRVIPDKT